LKHDKIHFKTKRKINILLGKLTTFPKHKKRKPIYSTDFYNNYISMLAWRFRLRLFLEKKKFYLTNINITEPIKVANKRAIKIFCHSH